MKTLSIRMDDDLLIRIKDIARTEHRSLNAQIVHLLVYCAELNEKDQG